MTRVSGLLDLAGATPRAGLGTKAALAAVAPQSAVTMNWVKDSFMGGRVCLKFCRYSKICRIRTGASTIRLSTGYQFSRSISSEVGTLTYELLIILVDLLLRMDTIIIIMHNTS